MSSREILIVAVAALILIVVVWLFLAGGDSPRPPAPRPSYRPPTQPVPSRAAAPVSTAAVADRQIARARVVFQQHIGSAREAEQERLRQQVLEQERRIAARLSQAQREYDFEELKALHRRSRETADLAYTAMKSAFATTKELSAAISRTHRAIDADRPRGGRQVPGLRRTLDVLHEDKNLVHTYCQRYKEDVERLNARTGKLRDAIAVNCGAPGRAWYQALMARTAARRDGRLR
jgi:hypothetical protein